MSLVMYTSRTIYFAVILFILAIVVIIAIVIAAIGNKKDDTNYKKTDFYKDTGYSYRQAIFKKGVSGEYRVASVLGSTNGIDNFVVHDLIIQYNNNSSQIDHIVIRPNGVFVIETKGQSGIIRGSESENNWTQILGNGDIVHKFYNPIKQNKSHIYNLSKRLKKYNIFISFICFTNAEYFPNYDGVGSIRKLKDTLSTNTNINLSLDEMKSIYEKILYYKSIQITEEEHISIITKKRYNLRRGICPRCGKQLVLKEDMYGEYYLCSGSPHCTFKKGRRNG